MQDSIGHVIVEEYCSRTNFFMFAHEKSILRCNTNKSILQNVIFVCPENNTALFPYGTAIIHKALLQCFLGTQMTRTFTVFTELSAALFPSEDLTVRLCPSLAEL